MKRILVVDDEIPALQKITRYLRQSGREHLLETAENSLDAVAKIISFQPDLVFLDIAMPGLSGLDVLRQFETRPFLVVFQTAFDEYALQAFEEHACDYLLKPFTQERFTKALEHACQRLTETDHLRALEQKLALREGPLRRIAAKQGQRIRLLDEAEILYFVSQDHCTCVYFGEAVEGICELSLNTLVERLDPAQFRQFHRKHLVRLDAIRIVGTNREGEMWLEMRDGVRLPVSRKHRRNVRELCTFS
ncbi:MAG: LytTR family DNA-binding domain-containing protein [Blastocatellia bacterium]|nr:LytTR family DNA-binding domain-containing protein [Blastocatellia bacterium]